MAGVTADRCPGVLRPHLAADGAMVRIRIPGGQTTGAALGRLGALATAYGSGLLQLTSRGSLQIRGLADPVPDDVRGRDRRRRLPAVDRPRAGPQHRRLAAHRAVRRPGRPAPAGHRRWTRRCAAAADLAELSGRFLFALDDGRGDVVTLPFDVAYQALDPDHGVILSRRSAAVW